MSKNKQIDELSKGTLGRYVKKAKSRMWLAGVHGNSEHSSTRDWADKTFVKKSKGIERAVDRLAKEENEEGVETDMSKKILEAVLADDFVALGEAFDEAAKAYSSAILEAYLAPEGEEEVTEEEEGEEESDEDVSEDLDEAYHDWDVRVHKTPDRSSEHTTVKVRARSHDDAVRYGREKAPAGFGHALVAKRRPGSALLNSPAHRAP
jgi:hypothetical protein